MYSSIKMLVKRKMPQIPLMAVTGIALIGIVLGLAGCSAQAAQAAVKATWIKPQLAGDTVSIPVSEVSKDKIVHFNVGSALGGQMAFMAYALDGKVYVRANVCPPCRSIGFSLKGDTLVCDTCRTVFSAKTGDGINGACVAYPKAAVAYQITGDNIVMRGNDLAVAYQNTLEPGWP